MAFKSQQCSSTIIYFTLIFLFLATNKYSANLHYVVHKPVCLSLHISKIKSYKCHCSVTIWSGRCPTASCTSPEYEAPII